MSASASSGIARKLAFCVWLIACFATMFAIVPDRTMSGVEQWAYFLPTLIVVAGVPWLLENIAQHGVKNTASDAKEMITTAIAGIVAIIAAIWSFVEFHNAPISGGTLVVILLLARINDEPE